MEEGLERSATAHPQMMILAPEFEIAAILIEAMVKLFVIILFSQQAAS
ncbi:hypothetical protein OH492_20470 [Vibrio chagasii]|nr:hypothetical protein [Vibrio chagasii]